MHYSFLRLTDCWGLMLNPHVEGQTRLGEHMLEHEAEKRWVPEKRIPDQWDKWGPHHLPLWWDDVKILTGELSIWKWELRHTSLLALAQATHFPQHNKQVCLTCFVQLTTIWTNSSTHPDALIDPRSQELGDELMQNVRVGRQLAELGEIRSHTDGKLNWMFDKVFSMTWNWMNFTSVCASQSRKWKSKKSSEICLTFRMRLRL